MEFRLKKNQFSRWFAVFMYGQTLAPEKKKTSSPLVNKMVD